MSRCPVPTIGVLHDVGVSAPEHIAIADGPDRESLIRAIYEHASRYGCRPEIVTWRDPKDPR